MKRVGFSRTVCIAALFCMTTAVTTHAQTFTSLVSFDYTDGAFPPGALMQGAGGNLYGVTRAGGIYLQGTTFSMTPSGTINTLYNFCSQQNQSLCIDGSYVNAPLVQGANGNFYGTSRFAGQTIDEGTAFELSSSGNFTLLYSFCSGPGCPDGQTPMVPLILGKDGNFYGTTGGGGSHSMGGDGGTIFRITPNGTLTTLYNFCARQSNGVCLDGMSPDAALLQASDGNFYGTTQFGGAHNKGTFFKLTPKGKFTSLHSLSEFSNPNALVEGVDGKLYGTTASGGKLASGTVFRITSGGQLTTLYNFCSQANCSDGRVPAAGLVQGTDGNFYGTTRLGGSNDDPSCNGQGCGTIFQITPAGKLMTIYNFCSQADCTDGSEPEAALMQASNGTFFGTTSQGGTTNCNNVGCGTVFSLSIGERSEGRSK